MAQVSDEVRSALARIPNPIELLESLFALAPIALQIYEASGRSIIVNDAFLALFGSQPPPGYNVLEDEIAQSTGVLGLIHRAFAGETITMPPTWYDPRDLRKVTVEKGNRVAMQATFFPLFSRGGQVSHVAVAFRDLTAELKEKERADREHELLAQIVDQMDDGVLFADADGAVRLTNRAARRQGAGAAGGPLSPLGRALRGEHAEGIEQVRAEDGALRVLAARASPVRNPDGSLRGAVVTTRDETERQRMLEESARTALFRERFIGIVGHDLRTPLAAIRANADLMRARAQDASVVERLSARIAASTARMSRMISDLLDFTQARLGGGLSADRRPADLAELARTAVDEAQAAHPNRSIELRAAEALVASVDPDRCAQLLSNLLDNALAYSAPGTPVRVAVAGGGGGVALSVSNQGPTLPAEERAAIFDPFRRGRSNERSDRRGLGLGLYIVEQIARAHGGTVRVESSEGTTTFTVELPEAPVSGTR